MKGVRDVVTRATADEPVVAQHSIHGAELAATCDDTAYATYGVAYETADQIGRARRSGEDVQQRTVVVHPKLQRSQFSGNGPEIVYTGRDVSVAEQVPVAVRVGEATDGRRQDESVLVGAQIKLALDNELNVIVQAVETFHHLARCDLVGAHRVGREGRAVDRADSDRAGRNGVQGVGRGTHGLARNQDSEGGGAVRAQADFQPVLSAIENIGSK